jgi:hypothetical protein
MRRVMERMDNFLICFVCLFYFFFFFFFKYWGEGHERGVFFLKKKRRGNENWKRIYKKTGCTQHNQMPHWNTFVSFFSSSSSSSSYFYTLWSRQGFSLSKQRNLLYRIKKTIIQKEGNVYVYMIVICWIIIQYLCVCVCVCVTTCTLTFTFSFGFQTSIVIVHYNTTQKKRGNREFYFML